MWKCPSCKVCACRISLLLESKDEPYLHSVIHVFLLQAAEEDNSMSSLPKDRIAEMLKFTIKRLKEKVEIK